MTELKQIDQEVQALMWQMRTETLSKMQQPFNVDEKSGRKDLVTTVDKSNEKAIVAKLRELDPDAQILGEEGFGDQIEQTAGRVWLIDPLDGTMNFVMQQNNFAIMISLYEDGVGVLGYIMDVMNAQLYHGDTKSVFVNNKQIEPPTNLHLRDALIGISGPLLINNDHNMQVIAKKSRGPRMYGSAGIEFAKVMSGELIGYISYLRPWDFAAGKILAQTLNLQVKAIDGGPLSMLSSNVVLVATERASEEVITLAN
ncbi:inositol monophosphatase family protein [Paucilactobacillus hokkaidonensis JCM 18461]|uniref:Inositol monophosphatase family protein n=2 Tax=Paucilactobacillus hokkaidonensis TaxID=1193095 RepID=A0A0A1GY64_9LACO|nr:inositol monophosphatase family protein [Paucilactobacillus hokkaidonensis]KRO09897.1 myo-inositol-1(or 4)-monophosphatase [Paucilactobacillus hokkaidonensis]BAP85878.1 inositol monophosphatase family protein [Paucilactobacillus hokkaidonensis JCM 18461]